MLVVVILLAGVTASPNPICEYELIREFSSLPYILTQQTNYTEMLTYSGLKLNDLGDYNQCNDLPFARYVLLEVSGNAGFAFCLPKVCSKEDIAEILSGNITSPIKLTSELSLSLSAGSPFNIVFPKEVYDENCFHLSSGAIGMTVFICMLSMLVLMGTFIELADVPRLKNLKQEAVLDTPPAQPSFPIKFLLCFSLYSNTKKLFDSRSAERLGNRETLDVLNGIRVMSIGWVILGHVTLQYISVIVLSNYEELGDILKEFNKTVIFGAFFAVDTFFWLSGLLMAYLFLKELDKPTPMAPSNWVLVYLHRYLRITPLVLFCILLWWSLQPYLGDGPVWFRYNELNADCPDYWWTVITYVNNFVPDWNGNGCLGVTWYLANDMQFFIFSPIILYVYHKHKLGGWGLIIAANVLSLLSSGLLACLLYTSDAADE